MPTLNWIGKQAVVNHHHDVPFHLLKDVPSLSCGDPGSGNLVLQADNLLGLKALLPYYAGKVKCIAIDPPYNTGNEGWIYNDNVNSPEIRQWLGKVVGGEGETLDRHDRWLCMMYPRLTLLREFLSGDGAIFVCLDDNEIGSLRLMMDEIFGANNFVANIVWQHSVQPKGYAGAISMHHNHIALYQKSSAFTPNDLPRRAEHNVNYANPDNDPNGPWRSGDVRNALYRPNLIYDLVTPSGKTIPPPAKGWRWSKETMSEKIRTGEIIFSSDEKRITRKIYLKNQEGRPSETIWFGEDVGTTREANGELKEVFQTVAPDFPTPKPTRLIERMLQIATNPGDLVLDSFAGSGTSGHAVMKLNAANPDAEPRRFIMVEMQPDIARNVTAERIRRVAEGYQNAKGEAVAGLGGGFRFMELGEALFDQHGRINEPKVRFADLARHVYFSETGEPLPKERINAKSPLLGVHHGRAIYLLYNGILGDKSTEGGNVLASATLAALPAHDGPKVVYAAGCRFSAARLEREGITFKQTPYAIRTQ